MWMPFNLPTRKTCIRVESKEKERQDTHLLYDTQRSLHLPPLKGTAHAVCKSIVTRTIIHARFACRVGGTSGKEERGGEERKQVRGR
jgi:hypothetical protein